MSRVRVVALVGAVVAVFVTVIVAGLDGPGAAARPAVAALDRASGEYRIVQGDPRLADDAPEGLLVEGAAGPVSREGWTALPVAAGDGNPVAVLVVAPAPAGFRWLSALLALIAASVAVALGAVAVATRPRRSVDRSPPREWPQATAALPAPVPVPVPVPVEEDPGLRTLVEKVIEVRDLISSAALSNRLGHGLAAVGYETVDPTGRRFDPEQHSAVDVAPPPEPSMDGTIAVTERLGYHRHGRTVRTPEVVVYQEQR